MTFSARTLLGAAAAITLLVCVLAVSLALRAPLTGLALLPTDDSTGIGLRVVATPSLASNNALHARDVIVAFHAGETAIPAHHFLLVEDPDGVPAMIARATTQAGGSPAQGVDERSWLDAFLDVRRATLAFATNPATRAEWAESVDRADAMRAILTDGNFDLHGPITINTPNHQATIP